ncbi:NEL-type E3 ubiquitin ligase domain-containing protein [Noviherbaspirillum galbum]|uniref:NEL domain-containing protein n=1 Tax=Noviherbaspirillum galbum TaxID=2709383 RepID=A0A6B3SUN1_9BURK|nr:NEL-type E3 ubiquitin ligase domain-containing protein [Noviherbaspirillum galbum]NEX64503.1 hypothetical protein [Noviherbaspirillum galbum]
MPSSITPVAAAPRSTSPLLSARAALAIRQPQIRLREPWRSGLFHPSFPQSLFRHCPIGPAQLREFRNNVIAGMAGAGVCIGLFYAMDGAEIQRLNASNPLGMTAALSLLSAATSLAGVAVYQLGRACRRPHITHVTTLQQAVMCWAGDDASQGRWGDATRQAAAWQQEAGATDFTELLDKLRHGARIAFAGMPPHHFQQLRLQVLQLLEQMAGHPRSRGAVLAFSQDATGACCERPSLTFPRLWLVARRHLLKQTWQGLPAAAHAERRRCLGELLRNLRAQWRLESLIAELDATLRALNLGQGDPLEAVIHGIDHINRIDPGFTEPIACPPLHPSSADPDVVRRFAETARATILEKESDGRLHAWILDDDEVGAQLRQLSGFGDGQGRQALAALDARIDGLLDRTDDAGLQLLAQAAAERRRCEGAMHRRLIDGLMRG